jgi:hypothetical protein
MHSKRLPEVLKQERNVDLKGIGPYSINTARFRLDYFVR